MSSQDVGALPQGNYSVNMKGYNSSGGGPQSNIAYFDVVPDTTPPTTSSDVIAAYSGAASIHFASSDVGTGVAHTYYKLDSGTQTEGISVTVAAKGPHTVEYWSTDNGGNVGSHVTKSFTVYGVDTTKPHTSASVSSSYPGTTTITLKPADNTGGCGVAHTFYFVDSGAVLDGTRVVVTGLGIHKVTYWSVDNLNNTEAHHTATITIVRPKAYTPTLSRSGASGVAISGYISCRYPAGAKPVRIKEYYRSSTSKAWTLKTTYTVSVSSASGRRSYYRKTRTPTRGYWRYRVYTVADATHSAAALSSWSLTVHRY